MPGKTKRPESVRAQVYLAPVGTSVGRVGKLSRYFGSNTPPVQPRRPKLEVAIVWRVNLELRAVHVADVVHDLLQGTLLALKTRECAIPKPQALQEIFFPLLICCCGCFVRYPTSIQKVAALP